MLKIIRKNKFDCLPESETLCIIFLISYSLTDSHGHSIRMLHTESCARSMVLASKWSRLWVMVHLFNSTNPKYGEFYGYAQPSKSFTSSQAKLKLYPFEMG